MTKLFGGILLIIGFLFPVLAEIRDENREINLLLELCDTLETMYRFLTASSPDMEGLLTQAKAHRSREIQDFLSKIRLDRLEEQSFAEQWESGVRKLLQNREAQRVLAELGYILGQYLIEEQLTALESTVQRLKDIAQRQREELAQQKKLRLTLAASAGTVLVILLL